MIYPWTLKSLFLLQSINMLNTYIETPLLKSVQSENKTEF